MDMKGRNELEEELKIYKDRLENAMETGNLAWWEMDLPSGEVRFNDRKADMLGYSPEMFEHYTDFTDLLHPEDHEKAMKAMRDHLEGKKEKYEVEYRIEKKDGSYKWFRDVGAITEKEGEHTKVTGVVIDIDDRKKIEKRDELLQSLLRHDMNNNLQLVNGYLSLIEDTDLPEEGEEFVGKGKLVLKNTKKLIEKIQKLGRLDEEEIVDVEISSVIDSALSKNEKRLEEEGIDVEFEKIEGEVKAGQLLKEVFSNLIENSILHANCGNIRISCKYKEEDVVVSVEDDGKGIPDEIKDKIFERGFKRGEEAGSGLGTFLVKEIVESYVGSIEVKDSELGGARFDIHLKR